MIRQQHGPCSDALQEMMRALDLAPASVARFHQTFPDNVVSNGALYLDDSNAQRLFYKEDAAKIDTVREELGLPEEHDAEEEDGDYISTPAL